VRDFHSEKLRDTIRAQLCASVRSDADRNLARVYPRAIRDRRRDERLLSRLDNAKNKPRHLSRPDVAATTLSDVSNGPRPPATARPRGRGEGDGDGQKRPIVF